MRSCLMGLKHKNGYYVRPLPSILGVGLLLWLWITPCVIQGASTKDEFPVRPIKLISPFAPGGGNDILSRIVAIALSKNLPQSVIVENRPGANTVIGMDLVANAAPDGYTLIMTSSSHAINATLNPKLPYDSINSFSPISVVASSPLIIAVNPKLSIKSVTDLISMAKARPGKLLYPSAGIGNVTHLGGELFCQMAGIDLMHVPYKGAAPGITDVISGELSLVFGTAGSVMAHINSGRLRAIAVTSQMRSSVLPDLPTVAESGLPGYETTTWYGILAPAQTPRPIVLKLNAEIVKALSTPDVKTRVFAQGMDPVGNSADEFATYIRSEIEKWARVIKISGVKVQ
jgi:tripartite-type tricarboxylate transporter receptor subunit TctC